MMRANKYLLFYAILGVGLAFSWTQVGKRAQITPDAALYIMSVEDRCRPSAQPCAAYARDFGFVLGPAGDRVLRLQALNLPASAEFELAQFEDGAVELEKPGFRSLSADSWQISPLPGVGRLRISVLIDGEQWMAEFPLQ